MTKALLMILPLPDDTHLDASCSQEYMYDLMVHYLNEKNFRHASFLGLVDGDYPQDVYVVKNRVGSGGSQPLSILEHHIAKTLKHPEPEEVVYGTYY